MPIKPEDMARYPGGSIRSPEWLAIRRRIRQRAGDCCEECHVANGSLGGWSPGGTFLRALPLGTKGFGIEWPAPGTEDWCGPVGREELLRIIRIVCTVAHVDGDLVDHSDGNLRFWCQRCHNRHDAKKRAANAAETRRRTRAAGDLIGGVE